ncbi:11429_t:CDS:2, partial [Gigaspora margarita]
DTSMPLETKEMELSLEESGQVAQTPIKSINDIISSQNQNRSILTTTTSSDRHKVLTRESVFGTTTIGAATIMETQSDTNNNTNRSTLTEDCFFNIDPQQLRVRDPYKKNDTIIEVDNSILLKQLIDNYQKYAYNNPYTVLGQQEISHNETQNLEQLNEDNEEDTTGETETNKMSYSEAVGCHQSKRTNKVIEHRKPVGIDTKEKIPDNINLIQEQITQTVGSGNEVILPITDYKKVNEMIKILKETFEFNNIPTHLLQSVLAKNA